MAKDNEKEILEEKLEDKDTEVSPKEAKKLAKLEAKQKKADDKIDELSDQIDKLREDIKNQPDQKAKNKLRKQRDELIAQREGIYTSKDGMTIPMSKKNKNIIKSVIAIVLIAVLLCVYIVTGAARHGLLSYFGVPQDTLTAYTITDGDGNSHNIKVSTYNYYFAVEYNNLRQKKSTYSQYSSQYGLDLSSMNLNVDFEKKLSKQTTTNDDGKTVTWAQYIDDEVKDNIKSTYSYYYEAVKANNGKEPSITDDQKKELQETLDKYESSAKEAGYALDGYLKAAMGKGVDSALVKREMTIAYISDNYKNGLTDKYAEKGYSEDVYNTYKKEHKSDLLAVDVKYFECSSADDAKKFKKALKADGSNFAELAAKYSSSDWDKTANKDAVETTYYDMTRSTLKGLSAAIASADSEKDKNGNETYSNLDWLYSSDRKAGDVNTNQDITSVVYIIKPAHYPTTNTVNIRHILVTPYYTEKDSDDSSSSSKDATEATADQWKAAYKQAQTILKEYQKGKKTADSFGELAKKYSEDNNASKGGVYENVTPNQMVSTFDAWCFDSARKAGDVDIVKTKFGYHVMYFEKKNDMPTWKYNAQQAMAGEDSKSASDKIDSKYTSKTNSFGKYFFEIDTDIDS